MRVDKVTNPVSRWARYAGVRLDLKAIQKERDRLFREGLHCLGFWHSHPGACPSPSHADLAMAAEQAAAGGDDFTGLIFVIIGNSPFELDGFHLPRGNNKPSRGLTRHQVTAGRFQVNAIEITVLAETELNILRLLVGHGHGALAVGCLQAIELPAPVTISALMGRRGQSLSRVDHCRLKVTTAASGADHAPRY
ncbi:Mov34/MPN/PAD-1 family protein [Pseudomonas sp. 10-1B]|uniref:Mov34/MPN/PAD-1 family protein n=1 Tax=Pseudomonas sp. 10-1B TaxID=1546029 RepID=UPI0039E1693F